MIDYLLISYRPTIFFPPLTLCLNVIFMWQTFSTIFVIRLDNLVKVLFYSKYYLSLSLSLYIYIYICSIMRDKIHDNFHTLTLQVLKTKLNWFKYPSLKHINLVECQLQRKVIILLINLCYISC